MIKILKSSFEYRFDDELLVVEAWGKNGIRVRDFADQKKQSLDNALLPKPNDKEVSVQETKDGGACLENGKIKVILDHRNRLTFYNDDNQILLREFVRLRAVQHDDGSEDAGSVVATKDFNSTLKLKPREFRSNMHGDFTVIQRFESDPDEKIFGMGQYQQPFLNQKSNVLELAQRNSQISVPFFVSSLGYGFLWNNPGIGEVQFAKNVTEWKLNSSDYIDYWITAGDNPKMISEQYANVSGTVPEMPENLLGLWQSKLRYRTPSEVIDVVENYQKRGVQLSAIAIDYFHWPAQGEYQFDEDFWPNPEELIKKLQNDYHVEPLISIWPTVQNTAKNYSDYLERGYLIKTNRGVRMTMQIQGNTIFADVTNPAARDYIWNRIEKNYSRLGVKYYWLDVAEPGYSVYDFDNYRYMSGTAEQVGNLYPVDYLRMVYEGQKEKDPKASVVTLVRGAWAGAQRYGALAWSGDIDSSFKALRNQVNTGLNMGISGIPWWTTDIGGFHGGHPEDPEFRELLVRWFQYATFSPILRMHGDRQPHSKPLSQSGGGSMVTGAPNEIWSYGPEVERILSAYIEVRETLKPLLINLMSEAHEKGLPLMRPLFYEFPDDEEAWNIDNTYMFGEDILVAPILRYEQRNRNVYLPQGDSWVDCYTGEVYEGGQVINAKAPLGIIPLYVKRKSESSYTNLRKTLEHMAD